MSRTFLVSVAAVAAVIAGALRVGTTFTTRILHGDPAELVYLVIDLGLFAGILAAYLSRPHDLGRLGFTGFVIALSGAASIVGPDGELFSIPLYQAGGAAMVLGLALLALAQLRARLPRLGSSVGWLAALLATAASAVAADAVVLVGVTFGLAFVAAGLELFRETRSDRDRGSART